MTEPRPFVGHVVNGEPVSTKHGIEAGIIPTPKEKVCKNCLYLIRDKCPESKGPEDSCEYFSK